MRHNSTVSSLRFSRSSGSNSIRIFSMSTDIHAEVRGARRHHPQPTQTPKYRNLGYLWRGCISPICSTSRTVSPLSVFARARYREYGPRNINSRTCDIAGRRTLISEIASGRYYRYRRYTQIGVQCSGVAAPVLTVSRVTECILVCSRR